MPWTVSEYDISQFQIRQKEGVSVLTYVRTDGRTDFVRTKIDWMHR